MKVISIPQNVYVYKAPNMYVGYVSPQKLNSRDKLIAHDVELAEDAETSGSVFIGMFDTTLQICYERDQTIVLKGALSANQTEVKSRMAACEVLHQLLLMKPN